MSNESGLNPYIDSGTGAVDGPPPSVTVESPPEHLSEPTGAFPNPPASVTFYADETYRPAEAPEAKAVEEGEVDTKVVTEAENKAVAAPEIKDPPRRGKRGTR